MATPHQEFYDAYHRLHKGFSDVSIFRTVTEYGKPYATKIVKRKDIKFWSKHAKGEDDDVTKAAVRELATLSHRGTMATMQAAVDCASIVFAHSILDSTAHSLLSAASWVCLQQWEKKLSQK